jgi:putative transposase
MKNDFVSKGRSVSDLKAHLVLTTKYRRKAFTGEMLTRLHEIFAALLVKWDCKIVEFNGEADHVHLLFQYHPDLQLSILVNNLKSVSSRKLRSEFAEHLAAFCGAPRSGSPTMQQFQIQKCCGSATLACPLPQPLSQVWERGARAAGSGGVRAEVR